MRARAPVSRADAIERGRLLFAKSCDFVLGASTLDHIPKSRMPEIAFAGRSNVGKSSLVNALTGRKTLARVSNTPGRTREINFFRLDDRLMLADLPGYGFARASKEMSERWGKLIFEYLRGRPQLRRVILLIDSRRGLLENDDEVMTLLDRAAVSYQLILTKTDKLKPSELDAIVARVTAASRKHGAAHPDLIATSAETGDGIPELRAELAALTES
jgi:GTP-binding protein